LEKEENALRITADQADRQYHKLIEWGKLWSVNGSKLKKWTVKSSG